MSNTLDAAGRLVDGVTFRIDSTLLPGSWEVGDGAVRMHHINGQQVNAKNLAAVMDARPGAGEDGKLEVCFAPDLQAAAVDALDGMDAHRRSREVWDSKPGPIRIVNAQGIGGLTEQQRKVAQRAIDGFDEGKYVVLADKQAVDHVSDRALLGACNEAIEFDESLGEDKRSGIHKLSEGLGRMGFVSRDQPGFAGSFRMAAGAHEVLTIRAGENLRELTLKGILQVDDRDEDGLPEQPVIDSEVVTRALEPFSGSRVSIRLNSPLGSTTTIGKLDADTGSHVVIADRPEFDDPTLTVGNFNLLRALLDVEDTEVELQVTELERPQPVREPQPPSEDEDLDGKIRMALASAKLMQDVVAASLLECALKWRTR